MSNIDKDGMRNYCPKESCREPGEEYGPALALEDEVKSDSFSRYQWGVCESCGGHFKCLLSVSGEAKAEAI